MKESLEERGTTSVAPISLTTGASLLLLAAFFMPWVSLLGETIPGYRLGAIWSLGRFAWLIPVTAACAAILGFAGERNREVAQLAGGIPLIFFAVAAYRFGGDLFDALAFGAYLTLLVGTFLLCVAPRLKPRAAAVQK